MAVRCELFITEDCSSRISFEVRQLESIAEQYLPSAACVAVCCGGPVHSSQQAMDPPDADDDRVFEVKSPAASVDHGENSSNGHTRSEDGRSPCCCGRCMLTRRQKEAIKLAALGVIAGMLYVYYQYVGDAIEASRGRLKSFPLKIVIPSYLALSAVRKLVPPINYLAPVGTIFTMYLADVLGAEFGALIYQAVKSQDIM